MMSCPRDRTRLGQRIIGRAHVFECPLCAGRLLEKGDMLAVLGEMADPSYWDRPECTGAIVESPLVCPRCRCHMLLQTLEMQSIGPYRSHGGSVQIDRCGRCEGIWLDQGEAERVIAIGHHMIAVIESERSRAAEELSSMGEPDFGPLSGIARFFGRKPR